MSFALIATVAGCGAIGFGIVMFATSGVSRYENLHRQRENALSESEAQLKMADELRTSGEHAADPPQ